MSDNVDFISESTAVYVHKSTDGKFVFIGLDPDLEEMLKEYKEKKCRVREYFREYD